MKRLMIVSSGVFLLLVGSAFAQQPSQSQVNAVKQSCRADYESYCSSVPTGGRASLQCLQQNIQSLSPPCHQAVAAIGGGGASRPPSGTQTAAAPPMSRRQEMRLMRQDCGHDFSNYCSGVSLGGGRGLACLMRNETRLSQQCRGALAEARQMR